MVGKLTQALGSRGKALVSFSRSGPCAEPVQAVGNAPRFCLSLHEGHVRVNLGRAKARGLDLSRVVMSECSRVIELHNASANARITAATRTAAATGIAANACPAAELGSLEGET